MKAIKILFGLSVLLLAIMSGAAFLARTYPTFIYWMTGACAAWFLTILVWSLK